MKNQFPAEEETPPFMAGIFILFCFLAVSCSTMQSIRQDYVTAHPELSPEFRQAILSGELRENMTEEMVRASWGSPFDVLEENTGGKKSTKWIYDMSFEDIIKRYNVRFVDGVVREIKLSGTRPAPIPQQYHPKSPEPKHEK